MGRPYRFFRSRNLRASPGAVFSLVNDFSRWGEWSPYHRADPGFVVTASGPAAGKGAVVTWKGRTGGVGRMELLLAVPNELVELQVELGPPVNSSNLITLEMAPAEGGGTEFSWTLTGEQSLYLAFMVRLFRQERAIAAHIDAGIDRLAAALDAASGKEA